MYSKYLRTGLGTRYYLLTLVGRFVQMLLCKGKLVSTKFVRHFGIFNQLVFIMDSVWIVFNKVLQQDPAVAQGEVFTF